MTRWFGRRIRGSGVAWLAAGLCLSAGALALVGYVAIGRWQEAAATVAQRRADTAADLLVAALMRDMRGAQATVLSSPRRDHFPASLPAGVQAVTSAFARYPYPEVFFTSEGLDAPGDVTFYLRADRLPAWAPDASTRSRTPVLPIRDGDTAVRLLERMRSDVVLGRPFAIFDVEIGSERYQAVTLLLYSTTSPERFRGMFGFLVNVAWVREHYFPAVAEQVARIASPDGGITYTIRDERNQPVAGSDGARAMQTATRKLPLAFFNPLYLGVEPPPDLEYATWTAEAVVSFDPTVAAADDWAYRSLAVTATTGMVLALGLVVAVTAARANANVAEMRSEFVSAVTHELKTPIAALMTISETLVTHQGDATMLRDYSRMALHETKRLHLLIENLLAYARITDVADVYTFEAQEVEEIVDDTLQGFEWRLQRDGFELELSMAPALPPIRADRAAVELALSNVIDNAIRYSRGSRHLTIAAWADGGMVVLQVRDSGVGITAEELPHVRRRFVRGRGTSEGGSGLGLAICDRILSDHGGSLTIDSQPGVGTAVSLRFPAWSPS